MKNLLILSLLCFSVQVFAQKMTVKPEYSFTASLKYEMVSAKKTNRISLKYLLPSSNEEILGIETTDLSKNKVISRAVFDLKSKAILMVMEDQKMAMVMPMDIGKINQDFQKDPKFKTTPIAKTGNTKVILGNKCEEWTSESEESKVSMWISTNLNLPTKSLYEMMKNSLSKGGQAYLPTEIKGFPLEIDTTKKKGGDVFTMLCVEINANAPTKISTAGLRVMGN
jgi:Domain of unknown function (DUF4412)